MHELSGQRSVGTRVNWGAILAGSVLALAICLLFSTLGAAVGLSRPWMITDATAQNLGIAWGFLIVSVSVFVGAMATSLLTIGENKTEGVIHGILVWAVFVAALFVTGTLGLHQGWVTVGPTSIQLSGNAATVQTSEEVLKRYAWLSFAGTWASMLAAALGAYLGAGTIFRVNTVIVQRDTSGRPIQA